MYVESKYGAEYGRCVASSEPNWQLFVCFVCNLNVSPLFPTTRCLQTTLRGPLFGPLDHDAENRAG